MHYFLICLFSLLSLASRADGLPINRNGELYVKHVIVKLTRAQQLYLEDHRDLFLTDEQQDIVRNIYRDDRIIIIDPHHCGCTCGPPYAVWISPTEIAFIGDTSRRKRNHELAQKFEVVQHSSNPSIDWYIGKNGYLYAGEQMFNHVQLSAQLPSIIPPKEDYQVIYLPPKRGNENWADVEKVKSILQKYFSPKVKIVWC